MGNENFQPPFKFLNAVRHSGGCTKIPFLRSQHSRCHGNNGCLFEAWGLIFIQKRRKKEWNIYFSVSSWIQHYKLALLPCIVTSFVFTLIYSIFPGSECEHTSRLFISVQFRSILLSGKTGKTFIWISPKVPRFWNWNYPPSWL